MTKKEVDKLRSEGKLEHDHELVSILKSLDKFTNIQYDDKYCYICIWCGSFIEDRNNIVYHGKDIYHLKCMAKVHEYESDMRDF